MNNGTDTSKRPIHPIGLAAKRAGLSPEVVRAWERRYGVVDPVRDDAGRRLYSDADVQRLRLLQEVTAGGRNIGQVAHLPNEELAGMVRADREVRARRQGGPQPNGDAGDVVAAALEKAREMDGDGLAALLQKAAAVLGTPRFMDQVVSPLFRLVGDAWHAGTLSIASEHLTTGVARSLLAQLRSAVPVPSNAPVVTIATPSGEPHEIGALLGAGTAAMEGWRVSYLGPDLPGTEIAAAAALRRAQLVAISVVLAADVAEIRAEVRDLRDHLPDGVPLVVGGEGAPGLEMDREGVIVLHTLDEFRNLLREH